MRMDVGAKGRVTYMVFGPELDLSHDNVLKELKCMHGSSTIMNSLSIANVLLSMKCQSSACSIEER